MHTEDLLRRLRDDATPPEGAQSRVRARLQSRIAAPEALRTVREALTPSVHSEKVIWERIVRSLEPTAHTILSDLKSLVDAADGLRLSLWQRLLPRLQPIEETSSLFWGLKWVAAMLLIAFVVQLSPRMFWASQTIAESQTTLLPTRGNVYLLMDELWQPLNDELMLKAGMSIKTEEGQATIMLGDDGVIRMDRSTLIVLNDISDRLEPASELVPTVTLSSGRVWVQGLVPSNLRGITVETHVGFVTVNEGSVSVAQGETAKVEVFDRRVRVLHDGAEATLITGEWVQLSEGSALVTKEMSAARFSDPWVRENLSRDAVHRQEIAAQQQTRLAQRAGILPTSSLYPMKRAVEAVDLFLTLGEEAKLQKQIQYADTRLTEAAALIATGQTGAVALPLEEYRSTLLALATGSGDGTLAQFLLRQSVVQTTGEISAALPGDEGYIIKKVVLETSSALSDGPVNENDVQGGMLLDALAVLTQAVESGNVKGVEGMWSELEPQLAILRGSGSSLTSDVRKEAEAALGMLALSLEKQGQLAGIEAIDPAVRQEITAYLPPEESTPSLSESDVQAIVAGIKQRIFVYHMTQPRINQFMDELRALEDNPDQGRVLRRLYFALPDGPESFPEKVRQEIIKLSWKNASVEARGE